jgi:hypothetical protein
MPVAELASKVLKLSSLSHYTKLVQFGSLPLYYYYKTLSQVRFAYHPKARFGTDTGLKAMRPCRNRHQSVSEKMQSAVHDTY